MPKPSSRVAKDVASRARGLQWYLRRVESLHTSNSLSKKDVERIYGGSFLEFHAFLELSIEGLFIGLLKGRLLSSHSSVRPLVTVKSNAAASAIVRGDRPYVDWLPYDRYTKRRAKAFFSGGRPFTFLDRPDISAFDDACLIRNALAHQSGTALRRFRENLVEGKNLPRDERHPTAYLRGFHTIGQTRMVYMLGVLVQVMRKLCH